MADETTDVLCSSASELHSEERHDADPHVGKLMPSLRFQGFTEAWEERKLGDFTSIKTGSSDLKDADPRGAYPFYVRSDNVERSNRYLYDGEAILIPGEGRLGEVFHYANGKFDYHQRVYKVSDFEKIDAKFVMYEMMRNFKKHALANTAKATVDSIRLATLTDFPVMVPSLPEQRAIGALFEKLDALVLLNERKHDRLAALKKSLLDKMFPEPGALTPALRLSGFTEPWEERKLGETYSVTMGQSPKGENYTDDSSYPILVQGNADLVDGWVSPRVWTKEITKTAAAGDLIFSVRAPVGAVGRTKHDVVLGRGVAGIKGNDFLYCAQTRMGSRGFWLSVSEGSTFDSINGDALRAVDLAIPTNPNEQRAIGALFDNLDSLIQAQQQKVDRLRAVKASLLDKIFV